MRVKLLAAVRPDEVEALVLSTFDRTTSKDIATRLDLLDVMGYLRGPASFDRLRSIEGNARASTSERLRALSSHALRDKSFDKHQALAKWVQDENSDLAARVIEYLPDESKSSNCLMRLEKLQCQDGMTFVYCQSLRAADLQDVLTKWKDACSQ